MKQYIDATELAGREFFKDFNQKGKFTMLNLLKFNAIADYSELSFIQPMESITGEEAYTIYMEHTIPHLKKAGSRILFYGSSNSFLIGPENEKWDVVLLVEHESVENFITFSQNKDYLKYSGHRKAALSDSRLLPIAQGSTVKWGVNI